MAMSDEERKKRNNVECDRCGEGIYRPPSKLKRSKVFYCSLRCHNLAQRERLTDKERKDATRQTKLKYAHSAKGKAKIQERYLKNRPVLLEYKKDWVKKNKKRSLSNSKAYYEINKDAISAKAKEYYQKNRVTIAVKQKKYNTKNKEVITKKHQEYYQENKPKLLAINRQWAINNIDKVLEMARKYRRINEIKIRADNQKMRDELQCGYIKKIICARSSITFKDIPQLLIDAKRSHLKCLRLIKELENGQRPTEN